jgi:carboxymethylenebutenolidase
MVTFRNGAESISGFLALPNGCGRNGGIIVLHEWWGLNDWVKMQATNLAANRYVVIAVGL